MSTKKELRTLERNQIWTSIYGEYLAQGPCYYCTKLQPNTIRLDNYEVGHIGAKSKGGSEHPDNKLPICRDCNSMADNGVKFMDLERYKFPENANHAHNPNKVYIKTQREYKPMDSNIKLILENSIFDDESGQAKPVPYSIAKHILDYHFPTWELIYKKYNQWGKIIIEPIGDYHINILSPHKHTLQQKEFEITIEEEDDEKKDLQIAEKYEMIAKYTFKARGELTDDDIQYIIDYLWDLWNQEHHKYGTINTVKLSGSKKNRTIEYRSKA